MLMDMDAVGMILIILYLMLLVVGRDCFRWIFLGLGSRKGRSLLLGLRILEIKGNLWSLWFNCLRSLNLALKIKYFLSVTILVERSAYLAAYTQP